jgi:hypothetical protein
MAAFLTVRGILSTGAMMPHPIFDFSNLTPEERIQLAEDLWDSLAEIPESVPLTEAQAEELDRRRRVSR